MVTSKAIADVFNRSALDPHFVGFDSLFDRLNSHYQLHTTANFPPYNIRKLEENKWQVEIALAGYDKKDLEIKSVEGNLVVKTKDSNDSSVDEQLIHRGISQRKFTRTFAMADDSVVNRAKMDNGMLYIEIERIVPEEKKPKIIEIK
tara:strand:+ start:1222 stop:1662 length:441 start_codon:yes stop_codon:yes gene_type:complete